MLILTLRSVLIGSRVYGQDEQVKVEKAVGDRLTKGPNPAAKVLEDQDQPQIALQSQTTHSGAAGADDAGLSLERLVAMGVPPKTAKILIEAGVHSRDQLTMEGLTAIEGVGEKTAEMVVALVNKPQA